jgi:hypothetical protein
MNITLTTAELWIGALCGSRRNVASLINSQPPADGFDQDQEWNRHIEGACGEIAAAKALGRYWEPSCDTFGAADIGKRIGVRTRSKHNYDLYVRPRDNVEYAYVLVTGKAPHFIVHGWQFGSEVRRLGTVETYGGRPPMWVLKQDLLRPLSELRVNEPPFDELKAAAE